MQRWNDLSPIRLARTVPLRVPAEQAREPVIRPVPRKQPRPFRSVTLRSRSLLNFCVTPGRVGAVGDGFPPGSCIATRRDESRILASVIETGSSRPAILELLTESAGSIRDRDGWRAPDPVRLSVTTGPRSWLLRPLSNWLCLKRDPRAVSGRIRIFKHTRTLLNYDEMTRDKWESSGSAFWASHCEDLLRPASVLVHSRTHPRSKSGRGRATRASSAAAGPVARWSRTHRHDAP